MRRTAGAMLLTIALLTPTEVWSESAAPVVLPPAKPEGAAPTGKGIDRLLRPLLRDPSLGAHVGAVVYDASRRKALYGANTAKPFTPASTMKVLTTTAALATLGPQHRFATRVVRTGKTSIALVGGGDPLLVSRRPKVSYPRLANLPDLVAATAKALRAQGALAVSVGYDTALFSGPAINTGWQPKLVGDVIGPTSALRVDGGRPILGKGRRVPDPARDTVTKFVALLKAAGIRVVGTPKPTRAAPTAPNLAQVRSASLGSLVEHVNLTSDNDAAEILLRHVGIATKQGSSYAGGLKGLWVALGRLGIKPGSGARFADGSGLSRAGAVPLSLLGQALLQATERPELRHVITGLPVAGFSGTLDERFAGPGARSGSGLVRAKTGTLTGVHALAGVVRTRTGTLLVFALGTDAVAPTKSLQARTALDRTAAALTTCGCH